MTHSESTTRTPEAAFVACRISPWRVWRDTVLISGTMALFLGLLALPISLGIRLLAGWKSGYGPEHDRLALAVSLLASLLLLVLAFLSGLALRGARAAVRHSGKTLLIGPGGARLIGPGGEEFSCGPEARVIRRPAILEIRGRTGNSARVLVLSSLGLTRARWEFIHRACRAWGKAPPA